MLNPTWSEGCRSIYRIGYDGMLRPQAVPPNRKAGPASWDISPELVLSIRVALDLNHDQFVPDSLGEVEVHVSDGWAFRLPTCGSHGYLESVLKLSICARPRP